MLVAYTNLKGTNDSIIKTNHGKNEYYSITKTKTIPVNILTREQKFNVWTGRLFWVALLTFSVFKIRNKILGIV